MSVVIGKPQEGTPFGEMWIDDNMQWTPHPFKARECNDDNATVQYVEKLKKMGVKAYTDQTTVMRQRVALVGVQAIEEGRVA